MIKNAGGKLYVGITTDVKKRLHHHNTDQGAMFTKYRDAKFRVVFTESYPSLTEARRREIQIKKWRRYKKELLAEKYATGQPTRSTDLL